MTPNSIQPPQKQQAQPGETNVHDANAEEHHSKDWSIVGPYTVEPPEPRD